MEFESYFIIYLVAKHSKHPNYDNLSSLLKMKPLHLKNSVIMSECYRICIFGYKCKRYKIDNSQSQSFSQRIENSINSKISFLSEFFQYPCIRIRFQEEFTRMIVHHLQQFLKGWKLFDRQEKVKLNKRLLLKQLISCWKVLCCRVTDKLIMTRELHQLKYMCNFTLAQSCCVQDHPTGSQFYLMADYYSIISFLKLMRDDFDQFY